MHWQQKAPSWLGCYRHCLPVKRMSRVPKRMLSLLLWHRVPMLRLLLARTRRSPSRPVAEEREETLPIPPEPLERQARLPQLRRTML